MEDTVQVTIVESEGCHFCVAAGEALAEAAARYPLAVRTIDARSAEGQALLQEHRATMSPLVLLDGSFFSHGRLPRRKLAKLLDERFPAGSEAGAARG